MSNIELSKTEKDIIRTLSKHPINKTAEKTAEYRAALYSLMDNGLVEAAILKESVMSATLTNKGRSYYEANPKLRGPVNIDRLLILATLLVSIITLFVNLARLYAVTLH